ncbi:MAG: cytochrome c3 family protein [Candidatus Omnitrophota bacterium]
MSIFNIKIKTLVSWLSLTLILGGYISYVFFYKEDKRMLLPGITTDGHYQIEMKCTVCHKADFKDLDQPGVINQACLKCHKQDLEDAHDSHPIKKFRDPRNAELLTKVDAMQCITCHQEHNEKITNKMGVTLPNDYCAFCHQGIGDERPSHKGLGFDTCATAGCHNYHDNNALYENFLVRHANEPDKLEKQLVPECTFAEQYRQQHKETATPLSLEEHDAPRGRDYDPKMLNDWMTTAHANAGVNCMACHSVKSPDHMNGEWVDHPEHNSCRTCHRPEVDGFLKGKHGMRLDQGLSAMTPAMARRPMKAEAAHKELSCVSCHSAHTFDRKEAAVNACLTCHNDQHSLNYLTSPHYGIWLSELGGNSAPRTGVSCATCHMPREEMDNEGDKYVFVQHNQNSNLTPNEKMIRTTCMQCHGLGFSIDAMADPVLINNNFSGRPSAHIQSIDMADEREKNKNK